MAQISRQHIALHNDKHVHVMRCNYDRFMFLPHIHDIPNYMFNSSHLNVIHLIQVQHPIRTYNYLVIIGIPN